MFLLADVWRYTIGVAIVVVLVAIFIFSYVLNKRTKAPEGCKKLDCEGCKMVACHNHPTHDPEKDENKNDESKGDQQ